MNDQLNEITTFKSQATQKSWTKDSYFISTDPSLVPISQLITIFDSPTFYWAKTLPQSAMHEMLQNSLVFGLYPISTSSPSAATTCVTHINELLGFARCVTDFTTFIYLTDVWISPTYQSQGLGTWLVKCVQEVIESMPYLRRSMLFTADWKRSVPFYERLMGMNVIDTKYGEALAIMERKGMGHPSFGRVGAGYGGDDEQREESSAEMKAGEAT